MKLDSKKIVELITARRNAFWDRQTVGTDEHAQRARDMADEYDDLLKAIADLDSSSE